MKLLGIGLLLAIMSWEPTCSPTSSTSSSSSSSSSDGYYNPQNHYNEPVYYSVFWGSVFDDLTRDLIDSAEVCVVIENQEHCQVTGRVYGNGYKIKVRIVEFPQDVKIKVTHPNYKSDSLLTTIKEKGQDRLCRFRLTRK